MHAASHALIERRYAAVHGAAPAADYPTYLTIGSPEAPRAVLGYRLAGETTLFLERYLDRPIEHILTERLAYPVPRSRVIELGDHASDCPRATITLWGQAAAMFGGQADVAVAVLTRPLRHMLRRFGLSFVMLAPARAEALGAAASSWGRYYDEDPIVCAGALGAGDPLLGRAGLA